LELHERTGATSRMRQRPLLRFASDVVVVAIVVLALVTTWLLSEALFFVVSTLFVLLSLVALRIGGARSSGTAAGEPLAERVQLEPAFEALAEQELVRARRYERPLTLLSVAVQNARARPEPSPELEDVAAVLSTFLRQSDLLGRSNDGRLLVLLPETSRPDATGLIARLQAILPEGRRLLLGTALFPDEEITWLGLTERARASEAPFGVDSESGDDSGRPPGPPNASVARVVPRAPRRLRRAKPFGVVRRIVDVAFLVLIAPFVIPLLVLLAIAVKLDSPGSLLVRHERVGEAGKRFQLLKLRTMVRDADRLKAELSHLNTLPWPDFKIPNDPRVTRVGRWLRRTSLDELPQLYNVLRGDMTLIGPRPCSIPVTHYELWQTQRLEAKPGIVGRWQADGRGRVSFAERCRMDIAQVKSRSLSDDISLVGRTVVALLIGRGAS
jgi:lipopolysaccharide/colanic/teichoic acid biosynthesis glycosyltransferase